MISNRQKKKRLFIRAFVMTLFMALFTQIAQAQTNVYMHSGTQNVPTSGYFDFYDTGGPESPNGNYFWERWYKSNENSTLTFKDGTNKIQVTFKTFQGWSDSGRPDYTLYNLGNDWSARLNDDYLYIYDGEEANPNNLLVTLTGNIKNEFTITANGPMTFKFVSNNDYQGEGWHAQVRSISSTDPVVNQPIVSKDECGDLVNILNPNQGGTVYYTLGGNEPVVADPLQGTEIYDGPISIDLSAANASVTVNAIVYNGPDDQSAVTTLTLTHNDQRPAPGVPTVTISGNTVSMKPATNPGLDETYNVIYTTDGTDPAANNGTKITAPWNAIEWHTPNTTFKVITIAEKANCGSLISEVKTVTFGNVTVPAPTITFNADGTATISCSLTGATIYYTVNGSNPTTSSASGTTTVTTAALDPGTTVKAYAAYSQTGYDDSPMASDIYVPDGGSTVSGGIVLLDDREDHTWSYYSDSDQPIHSLKPADVKITYKGFGENTMTSTSTANMPANSAFDTDVTASQVAVNVGEPGNQFIYLKTLENANAAGTGNYPYTMIANPFQVRPAISGGDTRTVYISWSSTYWTRNNTQATVRFSYTDASGDVVTSDTYTSNGNTTVTAKIGTTITVYSKSCRNGYANYSPTITARYDNSNGDQIVSYQNTSTTEHSSTSDALVAVKDYRGFYAWRVKSLGGGLSITGKSVGDIIYPDENIEFVTSNAKGNEVEFEALWAKAWVNSTSSSERATNRDNYQNAYERNFKVVTTLSTYTYPVTISTLSPDGTGTAGSIAISSNYTCSNDVKFENITFTGGGSRTFTAAGNDLIFGRGISGTINRIQGLDSAPTDNAQYSIRLESGTFNYVSWIKGYWYSSTQNYSGSMTLPGTNNIIIGILGCDYDRAKASTTGNDLLSVTGPVFYGFSSLMPNQNVAQKSLDVTIKSGKFNTTLGTNMGTADAHESIYMGIAGTSTTTGERKLTIEGGVLASVAGGVDAEGCENNRTFTLRMRNGTVNGAIYGAGAVSPAYGDRQFVITGGIVKGWIGGGCNGVSANSATGGQTMGFSKVYVGGNVSVGGSATINGSEGGTVFGAGKGSGNLTTEPESGRMAYGTNVVIADEATISNNVYGGGNYGFADENTKIYVLGGTIQGSVFGGSNQNKGPVIDIFMKDGKVNGNLYGGSNSSGTISGLATVNISGGKVTNVFGGGLGASTSMAAGTAVNVSNGTINNNVYGGGEQGSVTGNTNVAISGGTMHNVYGAGLGTEYTGNTWPPAAANANITGTTTVNVSGGTIANVYGGGENGSVAHNNTATSATGKSTVNVSNGNISGNVFGGGENGTTQGATIVNVSGGTIRGNVFGGALGAHGRIYVNGMRTVNMTGGHVYGNVYGGSRDANDGLDLSLTDASFSGSGIDETVSVTNISGGIIDQNVYAAGYFGNTFGSVYAFIGKDAIENAPFKQPTEGVTYSVTALNIGETVWAGGDWGTFNGQFGNSTVSGNSNIYVDGEGYETATQQASNAQYMNIGGSVLGCGTSCHAGKKDRTIVIRNYGHADGTAPEQATRTLFSIQFAKTLIFDNANVNFTGQGRINSLVTTEKYSIYEIANGAVSEASSYGIRLINGSGLFLNAPVTQIANFKSMKSNGDLYTILADGLTDEDDLTAITPGTLSDTPNKVRVNHGIYVEIKYGSDFGPLIGYAYMMASNNSDEDATCAYARPRWAYLTPIANNLNNPDDGGWVSYVGDDNTFDLNGNSGSIQMPYENHTVRNGEEYFRIWRVGGDEHYREGIFNAAADGTATFSTVDVVITLPAFRNPNNYYRFETIGDGTNTSIDYGPDVMTFNAANDASPCTNGNWMYFDEDGNNGQGAQVTGVNEDNTNVAFQKALTDIKAQPDVNFGLVAMPGTGMGGGNYIICQDADNNLANSNTRFTKDDNTKEPQVNFRLTYYNKLSANMTWDPMTIVLVQCDTDGNVVDRVTISLAVTTSASIEQEFTTQVYAIMNGLGTTSSTFSAKVVLPLFNVYQAGEAATFTLNSVTFQAANGGNLIERGGNYTYNDYAVEYAAGHNYDNTIGWDSPTQVGEVHDTYPLTQDGATTQTVGYAGGRTAFSLDFTLYYNGHEEASQEQLIGTLTYNITFDNYKKQTGVDDQGNPIYTEVDNQPLTIIVEVYRRGQGNNFYLDGVNGSNSNSGRFPNDAVKSLSTIFNRCGFLAGDVVYVVNKVTASNSLTWNGLPYSNVTLYRYNGGHTLKVNTDNTITPIVDNANNDPYLGELLVATNKVTVSGITMDGYYNPAKGETPETSVQATAPLVTINNGGTVELTTGTLLNKNYNSSNAGAVMVNEGGTLMMNKNAQIKDNIAAEGAGVYMNGTMIVSDDIQIVDNKKGTAQNNVYLNGDDLVITLGTPATTDEFGALSAKAKIGVTKAMSTTDTYTKVVFVDDDIEWLETPYNSNPNAIIYHDGGKYQLVKYTSPNYLYWVGTWVTLQDWNPKYDNATVDGYDPNDFDPNDITDQYELAWLISYVNGLNGADAHPTANATIKSDIDMSESIWVPIGTPTNAFTGTFNGNGHVITGLRSSLVQPNMGMFGNANGATIENVIANVNFNANAAHMGSLVGTMTGGTLSNVEAAGTLTAGNDTENLGGLVGNVASGTIHSAFAVNTMTGTSNTTMGGLVGTNGGDLYNSYANATLSGANHMGGLVGVNTGTVENCYVVLGTQEMPSFAYTNNGTVNYCYADKAGTQVGDSESTGSVTKSGTYASVKNRKEYGYMYDDNLVTALAENTYANHENHDYLNNHTVVWNGLLSVLNQWVVAKNDGYTNWLRPTTKNINGDLPVLAFAKDNAMATTSTNTKFLQYSAYDLEATGDDFNNGIDGLLSNSEYKNIFLYGNATEVAKVPASDVNVFINEDAVLLQKQGAKANDFINATVGVTFDNSCKTAVSTGDPSMPLNYDWHLMSSPLSNAPMGLSWSDGQVNWWDTQDWDDAIGQVTGVSGSYLPEGTDAVSHWDFYTYYEPEYHWINFKRNSSSHAHYEEPHGWITYTNETNLVPGKGYMAAIDQDSYLSNTGTLNNGDVPIKLTYSNDGTGLEEPTKDWGSNLVGNPYQAYLDLNAVAEGTGYTKFYIYSAETNQYVPFTKDQSSNTWTPSQFIHPHQAFFVLTDATDGNFKFTYDMATASKDENGNSYFRKGAKIDYPLINLFAKNEAGALNYTIIEVGRPELGGAEKTEALKTTDFDLYAHYGQNNYKLLFTPEEAQRVAVFFNTKQDGTYTLSWDTQNGEFSFLRLIDNITGVEVDMLNNDHYTFEGHATDYASRFYILFNNPNEEPGGNGNGFGNDNFAYYDGFGWIVNGEGILELIDVTGRVLYRENLAGDMNRVHLDNYKTGVYVLKLGDMTQKIIIK